MSSSTSNPAFSEKAIKALSSVGSSASSRDTASAPATIQGAVNKTMFLLMVLIAVSTGSWIYAPELLGSGLIGPIFGITFIAQLAIGFFIVRNPVRAKNLGILYALIQGVVLGAISFIFEQRFPNIVFQAILGTMGVVLGMLVIYKLRIIRVTENFKIMVTAAMAGVFFVYLISFVMSFFGTTIPYIHEGGAVGIGFSLLVIGIAAFQLAIDFDFIEKCEEQRAPNYMEWYGAFGLMVTIIWIYIEMLRLLSKSRK